MVRFRWYGEGFGGMLAFGGTGGFRMDGGVFGRMGEWFSVLWGVFGGIGQLAIPTRRMASFNGRRRSIRLSGNHYIFRHRTLRFRGCPKSGLAII